MVKSVGPRAVGSEMASPIANVREQAGGYAVQAGGYAAQLLERAREHRTGGGFPVFCRKRGGNRLG